MGDPDSLRNQMCFFQFNQGLNRERERERERASLDAILWYLGFGVVVIFFAIISGNQCPISASQLFPKQKNAWNNLD